MDDRKYMSRKFGMACFVLLSAIPLLVLSYISADNYVALNSIILGLYFTGNVVSGYIDKK